MNNELENQIIKCLPYESPFLFVNGLESVNENLIIGSFLFSENNPILNGHFKGNPIIPGVILLEVMGQIGMVCHFIYLTKQYESPKTFYPILANIELDYIKKAKIGEKLIVSGEKTYLRNDILKSRVIMKNTDGEILVRGNIIAKFIFQ